MDGFNVRDDRTKQVKREKERKISVFSSCNTLFPRIHLGATVFKPLCYSCLSARTYVAHVDSRLNSSGERRRETRRERSSTKIFHGQRVTHEQWRDEPLKDTRRRSNILALTRPLAKHPREIRIISLIRRRTVQQNFPRVSVRLPSVKKKIYIFHVLLDVRKKKRKKETEILAIIIDATTHASKNRKTDRRFHRESRSQTTDFSPSNDSIRDITFLSIFSRNSKNCCKRKKSPK